MTSRATATAPDLRRSALGVIAASMLMVGLEASIINRRVASAQTDLRISDADLQ